MLNRQYREFLSKYREDLKKGNTGILCNHTSFDFTKGKYFFELLAAHTKKLTVFIPEHGFFVEHPDQALIKDTSVYNSLNSEVEFVSVYQEAESRLGDMPDRLSEYNTLIIDIQDIGVRYYTYVTTVAMMLQTIEKNNLDLNIVVIDRPNPAGRQVEGTLLPDEFSSFIGLPGIPHRYGLTLGELCGYLANRYGLKCNLHIIKHRGDPLLINPSPNIPTKVTCRVFSGQCLIEGTNLSEGRGTTRPFETFGAPFLNRLDAEWVTQFNADHPEAVLRPLVFIPFTHKYAGENCQGFQLHPRGHLHSLWYTIQMLNSLSRHSEAFRWLEGPYEAWSDKPAIELLAGDADLVAYLKGNMQTDREKGGILEKIRSGEKQWIELTRDYVLYPEPLYSVLWDLEP